MALTTVRPQGMGFNTGRRNMVINGAMRVAQRGTSSTSSGGYFTVDRMYWAKNNYDELAVTTSQSTEAPSGFSNSFRFQVTTAESALAADELMYWVHHIEAQDLQHLNFGTSDAKSLTLSFWVRSSLTGTYSVLFYLTDDTRACTHTYTINSADTWEYKTITIDGDTTGVIDNDNGSGLGLYFTLSAGSDSKGTGSTSFNAYTASDFADSNQVDFAAQTGNYYITGIQLEVGENASDFEHRSVAEEEQLCKRYFQSWDNTASDATSNRAIGAGVWYTATQILAMFPFEVEMRAAPTFSTSATDSIKAYGGGHAEQRTGGNGLDTIGTKCARLNFTVGSRTAGQGCLVQRQNNGSTWELDAEL